MESLERELEAMAEKQELEVRSMEEKRVEWEREHQLELERIKHGHEQEKHGMDERWKEQEKALERELESLRD